LGCIGVALTRLLSSDAGAVRGTEEKQGAGRLGVEDSGGAGWRGGGGGGGRWGTWNGLEEGGEERAGSRDVLQRRPASQLRFRCDLFGCCSSPFSSRFPRAADAVGVADGLGLGFGSPRRCLPCGANPGAGGGGGGYTDTGNDHNEH